MNVFSHSESKRHVHPIAANAAKVDRLAVARALCSDKSIINSIFCNQKEHLRKSNSAWSCWKAKDIFPDCDVAATQGLDPEARYYRLLLTPNVAAGITTNPQAAEKEVNAMFDEYGLGQIATFHAKPIERKTVGSRHSVFVLIPKEAFESDATKQKLCAMLDGEINRAEKEGKSGPGAAL